MQAKVDVTHGKQKTTVTVNVPDGLQGLRLMNAAEDEARAHAQTELEGEVTRVEYLQMATDLAQ